MCGLAGVVWKNLDLRNSEKFKNAASLIKHRGPDYYGYYADKNVDFIHYRLSILDLDPRSNQPFFNADCQQLIIYNGEIYNFEQLSNKYKLFTTTTSDTEVLSLLLEKFQEKIIPELNGIFSFVYYDLKKKKIILCRDRLGVKPLYYYNCEDYFIFSSEAKVIYNFLDRLTLNYQALSEFMTFGSSIGQSTIVESVLKVFPGSVLSLNLNSGEFNFRQFWSVKNNVCTLQNNDKLDIAIKRVKSLVFSAVERQCISDVPVGAYLSGGLDSGAVVAAAAPVVNGGLNTYSVDFDYVAKGRSELHLAQKIARKFNTNHHEFVIKTKHIEDDLQDLIFQYDEPFADPAAIPLHLMAKHCSGMTKVVLQGDGGDEIFAGYGRHLEALQLRKRQLASLFLGKLMPFTELGKRMNLRSAVYNQKDKRKIIGALVSSYDSSINNIFNSSLRKELNEADPYKEYYKRNLRFGNLEKLQEALYTDMEIILPNTFLEKVDKVNMLHSIEARVPLLDNELVNYVMSLPSNLKIRQSKTKYLLREAMRGVLPDDVIMEKKRSFATPISAWIRTTLFKYVEKIFTPDIRLIELINYEKLNYLLKSHQTEKEDNGMLLWRAVVLITWLKIYSDKLDLE